MIDGARARISVDAAAMKARHPAPYEAGRRQTIFLFGFAAVLLFLLVLGLASLGIRWAQVFAGFGKLGDFLYFMLPPTTGTWQKAGVYAYALAETVAIALLGVLVAALLAFPVGFMAARNVMPSRVFHFLTRRILDSVRGIDELIWALIWVSVVGLGPFAGVLALICANFGAFGKLFSEAIEVADNRSIEGVVSTGGNGIQRINFGIIPQIFPVIAGQVLYYFESNTRSATIIGIVGAGGIGLHLAEQIRTLEYQHVAAIILMILVLVAAIDWLSTRLRFAIIGRVDPAR
jgi:phosphonate transport system permease protein